MLSPILTRAVKYLVLPVLFALWLASVAAPVRADDLDSPQSCSVTTAPGTDSFARVYHFNYVVDVEWWLQRSTGPGCTPTVRVAGNIFFTTDGNRTNPINGGMIESKPRLFRSGVLITENPPISFGSSGADGVYTFYSGWIARPCGTSYKGGIYVGQVAALGNPYEHVNGSWTSAGSYSAPAC